jgi:hypothetical protein
MKTLFFCVVKRYSFQKRVGKYTPKIFYEIDSWYSSNSYELSVLLANIRIVQKHLPTPNALAYCFK